MNHLIKHKTGGSIDAFNFDDKMALINLNMIYEYSIKLDKLVSEDTELEEWVKMKLTRIEQNISDVKHSLEGWEKFNQGGMIFKKQLLAISKYAKSLIEMIQGGSKLMSWQESKLAVCANDIDGIYHHLDYKMGNRASKFELGGKIGIGSEIVFFDKYYDKKRTGTIISEVGRNEYEVGTSIGTKLVNKDEIIGLSEKVEDDSWFSLGGVTRYPDLSQEEPTVIKDSGKGNFSEIDVKLVRKNLDIQNKIIKESKDAYNIFKELWDKDKISVQEQLNVIFINSGNEVIGYYQHTTGGVDATLVDVELIAALAVKTLSKGIIVAHNHPSGRLQPSNSDIKFYEEIKKGLQLFRIKALDSLILSPYSNDYYSFADNGYELGGEIDRNDIEIQEYEKNISIEFRVPSKIINEIDAYIKVFFEYEEIEVSYLQYDEFVDVKEDAYIAYNYEVQFLTDSEIEITDDIKQKLSEEAKNVYESYFHDHTYNDLFDTFANYAKYRKKMSNGGKIGERWFSKFGGMSVQKKGTAKNVVENHIAKNFGATSMKLVGEDERAYIYELDGNPALIQENLRHQDIEVENYGRKKRIHIPKIIFNQFIESVRFPLITPYENGGKISEIVNDEIIVNENNIRELVKGVGEGIYDINFSSISLAGKSNIQTSEIQNEIHIHFIENAWGGISMEEWNKLADKLDNHIGIGGFTDYFINTSKNSVTLEFERSYPISYEKGGSVDDFWLYSNLIDKDGNDFFQISSSENINKIVVSIKPIAYEFIGSGGGFYHHFFLMPSGQVVSFHLATGGINVSSKKYKDKLDFESNVNDDFWNDEDEELFKYEIWNLDTRGYNDKDFSNVKSITKEILSKIQFANGGNIDYDTRWSEMEAYSPYESRKDYLAKEDLSDLTFASKKFYKSAEILVKENLVNGEICMCKLRKILGHEPNYPTQVVGSLKLTKCFLRNFYKI